MKHISRFLFVFFLFSIIGILSQTHAATVVSSGMAAPANIAMPAYPPPPQAGFPFGQNERYSVVFRGNGEAVVTLNSVFSNTNDQPLSTLKFRVPKGMPTDVIAYQVIGERRCIQYDNSKIKPSPLSSVMPVMPCLQYQEPDYNQYLYGGYGVKYQKAATDIQTDTIVVTLPQFVSPNSAGSIILYYRSFGYAKKDLVGGFDFSFESLKIEDRIQNLQIGISTDSDLMLKGSESTVNYRFADSGEMMKTQSAGVAAPMANAQFDTFYRQIGQGTLTKTSSNLQPLDSYTVTGRYAKSSLQLYAKETGIGVSVTLVILIVVILLVRLILHAWFKKSTAKHMVGTLPPIAMAVIGSFIAAFVTVLYTIILLVLVRSLSYYLSSDIETLVVALVLVVSVGVYGLLLFSAPAVIALKKNLAWGAGTLGLTIGWLIAFTVIILLFFFVTHGRPSYYPPVYPMMRMESGSSGISLPQATDNVKE